MDYKDAKAGLDDNKRLLSASKMPDAAFLNLTLSQIHALDAIESDFRHLREGMVRMATILQGIESRLQSLESRLPPTPNG